MKRAALILFLIGTKIFSVFSQSNTDIKFSNPWIQLGNINEDSLPKSVNFTFTNMGNETLKVNQVETSSRIKVVRFTNTPLTKGNKGFIVLSVIPGMKAGNFTETIKVYSEKGNSKCNTINLSGTILPHDKRPLEYFEYKCGNLSFLRKIQDFKIIKNTQKRTDSLQVINLGTEAIALHFDSIRPWMSVFAVPDTLSPGQHGIIALNYDASKRGDFGLLMDSLWVNTDDNTLPEKLLLIKINIQEDFTKIKNARVKSYPKVQYDSYSFSFGAVERGQEYSTSFSLSNRGTKELIIRRVYAESNLISAQFPEKIKTTKTGSIKISMKVPLQTKGKIQHKIWVITNDPENPVQELSIGAYVN